MSSFEKLSLYTSLLALVVAGGSLLYTIRQVGLLKRQLQVDIRSRIAAVNRELLSLAFQDEELFRLFENQPLNNKSKQRHYIQMWLNHIFLMWDARQQQLLLESEWYADTKDISDFLSIETVGKHWEEVRSFYPPDFVAFVATLTNQRMLPVR